LFAITAEKHFGLGNMEKDIDRCWMCGKVMKSYDELKRGICEECQRRTFRIWFF